MMTFSSATNVEASRRIDDDLAAGQALADVIVGVAFQRQRHAARHERAEALAGRAVEVQLDRVVGQARGAVAPRHLAAGDGADDAVDVADRQRPLDLLAAFDRRLAQSAAAWSCRATCPARGPASLAEAADVRPPRPADRRSLREVEARAPCSGRRPRALSSRSLWPTMSLNLRKPSWAISSRTSWAMKRMKLTTWSGVAGELRPQPRILRGDADRAGVQMADAHHDAAQRHQRRRREAELLGPEQGADDDVAAGLELAVDLDDDAAAQVVEHQRLLRLGQAQLPRRAGVLDARQRRRAGAAVVAGDEHDVGMRLGDARGDGADADLGDQLDADAGVVVGVLQVVDQLRQILDRIDVVVRRRRDQAHARRRVPHLGDPRIDLAAGQLAALARLGALGHLDLQFLRVDQVFAGDAEAARGDLLDGAVLGVAVRSSARSVPGLRRLRRCCSCRRCGSWRWPASRAPPG